MGLPILFLQHPIYMRYSVIIPVYNRPNEVDELLLSLTKQTFTHFEVIVVEDGSSIPCHDIITKYKEQLSLSYYVKPNSGPGETRNYGAKYAQGDFLIILDSDCILPPNYFLSIEKELSSQDTDAFGGPDKADTSFTPIQKAINYAMTSFFTTGGIRGGKKKLDAFYPRSFNMGIKKEIYEKLQGFSPMRFGEDIDFSLRIIKAGYTSRLFPEAWVFHKRRTHFKQFFKQVHNSGIARIHLYKRHPQSLKWVHLLPSLFTLGTSILFIASFWSLWMLSPLLFFTLMILIDATLKNKNIGVGLLAIIASFIQLAGYGTGFIIAWWQCIVKKQKEFSAFDKNFYS
jgi:glycosyltransferase involved in cell wall biosynthesis